MFNYMPQRERDRVVRGGGEKREMTKCSVFFPVFKRDLALCAPMDTARMQIEIKQANAELLYF